MQSTEEPGLRCPRCLSRRIRDGSWVKGRDGEELEVRSMDGDMYQCFDCDFDGFLFVFQSDCPEGCLEIRDEKPGRPIKGVLHASDIPSLYTLSKAFCAVGEGCLAVKDEREGRR
jgi:hypothetical protein